MAQQLTPNPLANARPGFVLTGGAAGPGTWTWRPMPTGGGGSPLRPGTPSAVPTQLETIEAPPGTSDGPGFGTWTWDINLPDHMRSTEHALWNLWATIHLLPQPPTTPNQLTTYGVVALTATWHDGRGAFDPRGGLLVPGTAHQLWCAPVSRGPASGRFTPSVPIHLSRLQVPDAGMPQLRVQIANHATIACGAELMELWATTEDVAPQLIEMS